MHFEPVVENKILKLLSPTLLMSMFIYWMEVNKIEVEEYRRQRVDDWITKAKTKTKQSEKVIVQRIPINYEDINYSKWNISKSIRWIIMNVSSWIRNICINLSHRIWMKLTTINNKIFNDLNFYSTFAGAAL